MEDLVRERRSSLVHHIIDSLVTELRLYLLDIFPDEYTVLVCVMGHVILLQQKTKPWITAWYLEYKWEIEQIIIQQFEKRNNDH